nr:hypothetical protein [Actinomyces urogenitalis]
MIVGEALQEVGHDLLGAAQLLGPHAHYIPAGAVQRVLTLLLPVEHVSVLAVILHLAVELDSEPEARQGDVNEVEPPVSLDLLL